MFRQLVVEAILVLILIVDYNVVSHLGGDLPIKAQATYVMYYAQMRANKPVYCHNIKPL